MMDEKVLRTIRLYAMFHQQDNVIVALSGGADSVALFHFLQANAKNLGITVSAAHFEHGLRGDDSLQDAQFVKELCLRFKTKLHLEHGRMAEREKPGGIGTEEWARQLRYAFFQQLAAQNQAVVALGHTASDNAETVLFNAIRGTGTRGLAGIPPVRSCYCRPLLQVERTEVEAYCRRHGLAFVQDATNADNVYSRNRLRNQVIPLLEKAHPGAARSLMRLAEDMRTLDDWLGEQAEELLQTAVKKQLGGGRVYNGKVLLAAPEPVRTKALALLAGPKTDRETLHRMQAVLEEKLTAADIHGKQRVRFEKGFFYLVDLRYNQLPPSYEYPLEPGTYNLPGGYRMTVKIVESNEQALNHKNSAKKGLTFVADYDKIINYGIIRTRRTGDCFWPPNRNVHKNLKKWMNEQGIIREHRPWLPLVASGCEILWVWGVGFCNGLKPDAQTERLIIIESMENEDG